MRKLEIKDADIMRISVQQEILRSDESRYDHKLHGILLVSSGYGSTEVARLFGHSPLLELHAGPDGLRTIDALMAATALREDDTLATANHKHFKKIAGLDIRKFAP